MVNGAGDLVNRLCHGLADGNGWSALGGESPRGREAVNGAGIWVNGLCRGRFARTGTDVRFGWWRVHAGGLSTDSVANSRTGTDVRFGRGRVHAGGNPNLTCLRESMIDRGSSPREQAG